MEADAHRKTFKLFEIFIEYTTNIQLILLAVLIDGYHHEYLVNELHFGPDDLAMYIVFLFFVLVMNLFGAYTLH